MIEITFFGEFKLQKDGVRIELPSRPAQSLFAYLVLNAGKTLRREKVAGMLWPEKSEAVARSYLRHALCDVRKTLTGSGLDGRALLPEDNLSVKFCIERDYWLDVSELLQPASAVADIDVLIDQLQLYGEFLPGFTGGWDEWTSEWREQLEWAYVNKALHLIDRLIKAQRWHDAIQWSSQLVLLNSSVEASEAAQRTLFHALRELMSTWRVDR